MDFRNAIEHFSQVDPLLYSEAERVGTIDLPKTRGDFESLVNSIVSQQLSVKAAATIYQRVCLVLENEITPTKVLETSVEQLRSAGLSGQKTTYLYALAEAFNAAPLKFENLHHLADKEIIEALTTIKGIGVWTAQMFLMFTLLREDVFPVGDLGIRRGMERLFYGGEKQSHAILAQRAEIWSPYRSVACFYLWNVG